MKNSDMPAMPYIDHQVHEHCGLDGNSGPHITEHNLGYCGLTKLEYFAGLALQGDWASQNEENGSFNHEMTDEHFSNSAKLQIKSAKALLAELEKEVKNDK